MQIKIEQGPFNSPMRGGEYSAAGPGGQFPAWCAEQTQSIYFGEVIDYQQIDGVSAWGAPISESIDRLMSWAVGAGWPTTLDQNDAIQADIWSILAGGTGKVDAANAQITKHAMLLHNPIKQDLLVSAAISEPDPSALLLLGVVAIALAKKSAK